MLNIYPTQMNLRFVGHLSLKAHLTTGQHNAEMLKGKTLWDNRFICALTECAIHCMPNTNPFSVLEDRGLWRFTGHE